MRNTYSKQLVQERTGRELEPLLRELFIERRHSLKEIAAALGVNRETVRQWTVEYGISRDDRPPLRVISGDGTPERIVAVEAEQGGAA